MITLYFYAFTIMIFDHKSCHLRMQSDRNISSAKCFLQRLQHIGRLIRLRKHAIAALCLYRQTFLFQEVDHTAAVKTIKGTVHKFRIGDHMIQMILYITVIGDITPAFSCNK